MEPLEPAPALAGVQAGGVGASPSPAPTVDPPVLRLVPGGVTNSRPTTKNCRRGIDTVRLRWRADTDGLARFNDGGPAADGPRGERWRTADGVRFGAYPDGMTYAEGRLAAMTHGPDDHSLPDASALPLAAALMGDRLGLPADDARVGRLDLAADLTFPDGQDGLDFLNALAVADVPWARVGTEGAKRGDLQTVYLRSIAGRTILARAYDKGVESGTAPPGELVRFERQRRFRASREMPVAAIRGLDLGRMFVGRELASFIAADRAQIVCDAHGAANMLGALVDAGELSSRPAARLAGFLALRSPGRFPTRTERAYFAELRRLGIVLDPLARPNVAVPVGGYLRTLAERWAA